MVPIPVKSGTTGLLIDKKEDMPKKVALYCDILLTSSLNFKLNEELKAGLIRLGFDVFGFQEMEQSLEKQLLYKFSISHGPTLRLKSPEIARLTEEEKTKLTEQLGLQALFIGVGLIPDNLKRGYYSLGDVTRIKMELVDIKTAKIIWSVEALDRGMSEKSAYLNTAKQVLKLLEKDIKAFDK